MKRLFIELSKDLLEHAIFGCINLCLLGKLQEMRELAKLFAQLNRITSVSNCVSTALASKPLLMMFEAWVSLI